MRIGRTDVRTKYMGARARQEPMRPCAKEKCLCGGAPFSLSDHVLRDDGDDDDR